MSVFQDADPDHNAPSTKKNKKRMNSIKKLWKSNPKKAYDNEGLTEFTVCYESSSEMDNEQTHLLKKSKKVSRKKKESDLDYQSVVAKPPVGRVYDTVESIYAKPVKNKKMKKKRSLLKRTGRMIVKTCRLMVYADPHNVHFTPDHVSQQSYRYYDYERREYVYGYGDSYMGTVGTSPSVFF